jgi:hypothetical protein
MLSNVYSRFYLTEDRAIEKLNIYKRVKEVPFGFGDRGTSIQGEKLTLCFVASQFPLFAVG